MNDLTLPSALAHLAPVVSGHGRVAAAWIDHHGHMNVGYYGVAIDAGLLAEDPLHRTGAPRALHVPHVQQERLRCGRARGGLPVAAPRRARAHARAQGGPGRARA